MKKLTLFLIFGVIFFGYSSTLTGQRTGFRGLWKLDMNKSTLIEYTPKLIKISVQLIGDSLFTERTYEGGDGQEYPFNENVTLDGKEYNITIYDMPRKAKASWSDADSAIIIESTTMFTGDMGTDDFISVETWKTDNSKQKLTITFKNKTSGGESEGIFVFDKVIPNS